MDKDKIYPRSNDNQTVYLKSVITRPTIEVGDFTVYNDFVNNPRDFERNNVLYHYPINNDRHIIGKFCRDVMGFTTDRNSEEYVRVTALGAKQVFVPQTMPCGADIMTGTQSRNGS